MADSKSFVIGKLITDMYFKQDKGDFYKKQGIQILYINKLKYIEIIPNNKDRKRISIQIKDVLANGKENYTDKVLEFADEDMCNDAVQHLINQRSTSKQIEMSTIVKILDYSEKDIYKFDR